VPEPQHAVDQERQFRYAAFISYKRDADITIASALQRGLHRLAKPWYRLPSIRVFRDQTDLVINPGLWSAIEQRLDDSEHLILLASPEAVASPWVEREVAAWMARRSRDKLLIVLTSGEIAWSADAGGFDAAKTTALPAPVRAVFEEEPSYLDLRWARGATSLSLKEPKFRDAVAELLARLTGREKADVVGEDLRQQRRALRLAWTAVAALVVLASTAVAGAWLAIRQRQVAEEQRTIAVARQLVAQSRLVASERSALLDRSALLAVEGARMFPSIETDQALRQSGGLLSRLETTLTENVPVAGLAVSPAGRYIATASGDGARLWDLQDRREVARLKPGGTVRGIVFSADGQWLATGSDDGSAVIWNGVTGAEITRVMHEPIDVHLELLTGDGDSQPVTERRLPSIDAVALTADRRYLATASADHTARVFDLSSRRQILRGGHGGVVTDVAFSPDGRFLASVGHDNTTRVWSLADGREIRRFVHDDRVECVTYSPDGRRLASGGFDRTARVWDLEGRRAPILLRHDGPVTRVAFSPSGKLIATASWDGTARVWDASGRELFRSQHQATVRTVEFSRDERRLLTASDDGTGGLVEIPSGLETARVVHQNRVNAAAFSADGRSILTASDDATVKLWSATGGGEVLRITHESRGGNDEVNGVAFSADEKYLSTLGGGFGSTARVWELLTGQEVIRTTQLGMVGTAAANLPGGRLIVTERDVVKVWDGINKAPVVQMKTDGVDYDALMKSGGVSSSGAAFSADGRRLAKIVNYKAYLWEIEGTRATLRYQSPDGAQRVAFASNGRYLAIGDGTSIEIRDVDLDREAGRMTARGPALALAVSSDGALLAAPDVASVENSLGDYAPRPGPTVRVRQVATGAALRETTYESGVTSVAFDPTGRYFAAGTEKGVVSVVEIASGLEIARVRHLRQVNSVAFSRSGRYLASASEDGTARVWLWQPADLIAETCRRVSRNLSWQEWQQYQPSGTPYAKTCESLPVHPSLIEAARTLARENQIGAAAALFRRATELDSSLAFDPGAEAKRWAAVAEGERLADEAQVLAKRGEVQAAVEAMTHARALNPDLDKSPTPWNQICWFGSLRGRADLVLQMCDKAVSLRPASEGIRDSRGIARALTGNITGAIEDFEAFIAGDIDARKVALRRQWVDELRAHKNPFDAGMLASLLADTR